MRWADELEDTVHSIIDTEAVNPILNEILKAELSGVVRYTHYSLVITGPNRLPLVEFMKAQAAESLLHAQQAGEILTGLGGHPEQGIAPIEESHDHTIEAILRESIVHERHALDLYRQLLQVTEGASIYLEEYARGQIGQEELHVIEMNKLLRDYSID
jgi:bacterioferritin